MKLIEFSDVIAAPGPKINASSHAGTRATRLFCGAAVFAVLTVFWLAGAALPTHAGEAPASDPRPVPAGQAVELTFTSATNYADPFNAVQLDALVTDPEGRLLRVPAFWAGGSQWRVRYASGKIGRHTYRTECSDLGNPGLHDLSGVIEVAPYHGQNPLYQHGPLRAAPSRRYLEHADGTPFFWLGDTWWMGLSHRLHWPGEFQELAADRKAKGFNVIQIVAGLYPDMPAFDPRGANEAGFPWATNFARIRPEYFDAADQRLRYLVEEGFVPCIVGAWGYFLPWMGVDKAKQHWRYLIARYGAWPVVWCVAGEANLPWYRAPGFPCDDRQQVRGWTEVMRYVREIDPFKRLVTIHPTAIGQYTARHATDESVLLDFDLLQTPHGQREAVPVTVKAVRDTYGALPTMPVINGEASYEMLLDSLPTEWTRRMFWLCLMNGAAGHTYGANGIWQVNRKDQPHGASPHGGNYGKISWDDAMRLPGSRQAGLGKRLFEQYPWPQFKPHPEWAEFSAGAELGFEECHWLWYPEGEPARDAPTEKRFFQKTFVLPPGQAIARARLRVSADDWFAARLNGQALGQAFEVVDSWHTGRQFEDLAPQLKAGTNVLAIIAENKPSNVPANPAGLIGCLEVTFSNGESLTFKTDATWHCAKAESAGWDAPGFDSSAWVPAKILGRHGVPPWGSLTGTRDEYQGPQAAGIPGVVRVIYVPGPQPIVVRNLGSRASYRAIYFDPVSGEKTPLGEIRAEEDGRWICPAPTGQDHDWVLLLETRRPEGQTSGLPAKASSGPLPSTAVALANEQAAWHLDWADGRPRSTAFENKISQHRFAISAAREVALHFSAALDRVAEPVLRVADFTVREARLADPNHALFILRSPMAGLEVTLHYRLDGPTRRKWLEVTNHTDRELLLLDVELDDFTSEGATGGGGQGQPVFIEDECFAAVEHPAGINQAKRGRVQLRHHPGQRLKVGGAFRSFTAAVSMAGPGRAAEGFVDYIDARSRRQKKVLSIYTPFGINNQWGACPTLDDEQTLDVLGVLERWQAQGMKLDYFTLDTGWVDPASDLTRFRTTCYPNGPGAITGRVQALDMRFGLWFGTSWAAESCWDYPPALAGQGTLSPPYRLGYPDRAREGRQFCFAAEPYFRTFSNAVIHHVRETGVRFVKFDGGSYGCASAEHGHLPGPYATERMHEQLITLAQAARAAAPDLFVMWYWGLRSPFWAWHGDTIFESGLHMEGSGTSPFPTLYYRDSVTLAQDQNARHARLIPPLAKDSLGVWLADTRWGNFMGKERWREALVMDLGRGSLLFPNLWGNLYYLDPQDVQFLSRITSLARQNQSLFLHRRELPGDPFRNEVYGYAHGQGAHSFVFLNNAGFQARRAELLLDQSLGLDASPGTQVSVVSHFPENSRLARLDGSGYRLGDHMEVWLRPFEVLLLEVAPPDSDVSAWPARAITRERALALGQALPLRAETPAKSMDARFVEAGRLEPRQFAKKTFAFETKLPSLDGPAPILAVSIRLRQGESEWKYAPVVAEIVQVLARVNDQNVQLIPVPEGRQHGNTQSAGCSWIVYKVRLNPRWSQANLKLAIHALLPPGVQAHIEAWVLKRWWQENTRPTSDGYYADAPF